MSSRGIVLFVAVAIAAGIVLPIVVFLGLGDGPDDQTDGVAPGSALPGKPWTGKGDSGASQAEAERFDGFPLFWLGPSHAGFHLQSIQPVTPSAPGTLGRGTTEVMLIYGTCRLPGGPEPRCAVPLSVRVQPACSLRPQQVAGPAYPDAPRTLPGGALLMQGPGAGQGQAMIVWTGRSMVQLTGFGLVGQVDAMVNELRRMGDTSGTLGSQLPAPDFSGCS